MQSADVSKGSVHPVLVVVVLADRFDGDHLRAEPWSAHVDQHGLSSCTNTFLARLADSSFDSAARFAAALERHWLSL